MAGKSGKNNGFIALIGLLAVVFGIFAVVNLTSKDDSNKNSKINNSGGSVSDDGKRRMADIEDEALATAVTELCGCFDEVLAIRASIAKDPNLEYELSSKLKKAEIQMRSCYTKTKQRHSSFGDPLLENFGTVCPEAQSEL
jgi:hypothetical protein